MSLALARAQYLEQLRNAGVGEAAAVREMQNRFPLAPEELAAEDERLEAAVQAEGDRMMARCGFASIHFARPGKTKQTPGIPDRRYYRRPRVATHAEPASWPLIVWVEYKSSTGRQRPGQKLFQELAEACGEEYVLGGLAELRSWLTSKGLQP